MTIDKTSKLDVTSRLGRTQAKKLLAEILNRSGSNKISFSKHCLEELKNDDLTTVDVFNVLKAGQIYKDPEFIDGAYRYRVETNNMLVVISFLSPDFIRCITAWRKKK